MSVTITRTDDLETCLKLRFEVFVDEQGVPPEIERDAYDEIALHLLATEGDRKLCVCVCFRNFGIGCASVVATFVYAVCLPLKVPSHTCEVTAAGARRKGSNKIIFIVVTLK